MTRKNSIACSTRLKTFAYLVSVLLLSAGCSKSAINETARKEAEAIAKEATGVYEKSQGSISLRNPYTWQAAIEVNDEQTRKGKFVAAAKQLEQARDKFLEASTKMTEALNGQKAFDNQLATQLSRTQRLYQAWSELAEFEMKTWQDASSMSDTKLLTDKLKEAHKKQQKLNEVVTASIQGIG